MAGVTMTMVVDMSVQASFAQNRASNFGLAEATAVSYAAKNEGGITLTPTPDGCTVVPLEEQSYSITCTPGVKSFKQSVTRSFRLAVLTDGDDESSGYRAPVSYTPGVFCPLWDPWGVINYNDSHNVQCIRVTYEPWASNYTGEMLW